MLIKMNCANGGGGGSVGMEYRQKQKTGGGSSNISVTDLTHKPRAVMLIYSTQYYYWTEESPSIMEYYNNGTHDSTYDVTGTFTVTDTSFVTPNFELSGSTVQMVVATAY